MHIDGFSRKLNFMPLNTNFKVHNWFCGYMNNVSSIFLPFNQGILNKFEIFLMTEGQKLNKNYFNLLQLNDLRGWKNLYCLGCDELGYRAKKLMQGYTILNWIARFPPHRL